MKFYATKKKGLLVYEKPLLIEDYIKGLKEDQALCVEIKVKRKFRSLPQNKFYWLILEVISEDTGATPDELHDSFKAMFLTDHTKKIPIVRSTTCLDTNQFTLYLDKIEDICRDKLGIILPRPEDLYL